ncbi:DUF881 domain-containing protein [Virgibacillus sp. FSP13]
MKSNYKITILIMFALAGFIIAISFQFFQEPKKIDTRDTRDTWELKADIQKQQKVQQKLYADIQESEKIIKKYEKESVNETIETLKKSVQKLKQETGFIKAEGKGIVFTLAPLFQDDPNRQAYPTMSPELLSRFMNELNKYGAMDTAIENERIISLTAIRDVNGSVYVNNHPIPSLPFDITVLVDNPEKLQSYIEYSNIRDAFAAENINLTSVTKEELTLPAYDEEIRLNSVDVEDAKETDGEK